MRETSITKVAKYLQIAYYDFQFHYLLIDLSVLLYFFGIRKISNILGSAGVRRKNYMPHV